jgi:hypothetical protein
MCRTAYATEANKCRPHAIGEDSMIPRVDLLARAAKTEASLAAKAGAPAIRAPLSQILLAAEAVVKGDIDISETLNYLLTLRKNT